jgi:N-acetylglucosaminyldiphosphoundecaprenol N-acetyl-beta-D-mannosaminyltransferase
VGLPQTNESNGLGELKHGSRGHASADSMRNEMSLFKCGRINMISLSPDSLFAGNGRFLQITPVNAEVFVLAHENRKFGDLLQSTINVVDGRVLQLICKLLYPSYPIVLLKGANFIYDLAEFCRNYGQRLFLLGSTEVSNSGAVARLRSSYPGLQVSGFGPSLSQSPFEPPCRDQILAAIEQFRPHHLGVCFGPIRQELWIQQNARALDSCGVRSAYALGGTVDFLSSTRVRAPHWVQYIGAEWLFRFLCEPRARFYRTLIQFKMPFYAARTRRSITPTSSL